MHAQQIPLTPHPIPTLAGSLGSFAGPMGLPHGGPQALLKMPQDLHREDIKVPLGGPSSEERLVISKTMRRLFVIQKFNVENIFAA